ncbi:MAG: zinc ribbon domain-containing protein [Ruminococcus sp.]|nr:zinc ribbon domain-containing protein [Ruminococcus sp.]
MICSSCGKQIADHAKFCSHCGAKIALHESEPAEVSEKISAATQEVTKEKKKKRFVPGRLSKLLTLFVLVALLEGFLAKEISETISTHYLVTYDFVELSIDMEPGMNLLYAERFVDCGLFYYTEYDYQDNASLIAMGVTIFIKTGQDDYLDNPYAGAKLIAARASGSEDPDFTLEEAKGDYLYFTLAPMDENDIEHYFVARVMGDDDGNVYFISFNFAAQNKDMNLKDAEKWLSTVKLNDWI